MSVRSRTWGGWPVISALPPALSAIGPYASVASVMPSVAQHADGRDADAVEAHERSCRPPPAKLNAASDRDDDRRRG